MSNKHSNPTHISPPPAKGKGTPATEQVRDTGHPLLRGESQALEYFKKLHARDEQKAMRAEELAEWKLSINRIAATPDGQKLLRAMVILSGLNTPREVGDTIKMVGDKLKADFYLRWVKPFLEPEFRKEIE